MTRTPKPTDFDVPIPGVGDFTFAKRTIGLDMAINREICRISQNVPLDAVSQLYTDAFATLKVLTVEGPPGWAPDELEDMDSYDPATYENIIKVWEELRKKEETFRSKWAPKTGDSEGEGAAPGGDV